MIKNNAALKNNGILKKGSLKTRYSGKEFISKSNTSI